MDFKSEIEINNQHLEIKDEVVDSNQIFLHVPKLEEFQERNNNAIIDVQSNFKVKEEFFGMEEDVNDPLSQTSALDQSQNFLVENNNTEEETCFRVPSSGDEMQRSNSNKRNHEMTENLNRAVKKLKCDHCYSGLKNFCSLTINEKIQIKNKGRPTPNLLIEQPGKSRNKEYVRKFSSSLYKKCDWICGCEVTNSFFCFPCLLFGGDSVWTEIGLSDLKRLPQKIKKHETDHRHINNVVDLSLLGKGNISYDISAVNKLLVSKHNDFVKKNREVLSKIIDCIIFCGKFELPISLNEEISLKSSTVFHGLINFSCNLDPCLDAHYKSSSSFNETFNTIHNDLLDSILTIYKNTIREEIKKAQYLAIMCDETTDICNKSQISLILRYVVNGKPVERFWGFFSLENVCKEVLLKVLLNQLSNLIPNSPEKLIAQSYDGAACLTGSHKGVQSKIKEIYTNAHYIHSYTHQLNFIEKVTSIINKITVFFGSLSGISAFLSKFSQRTTEFEKQVPQVFDKRWNCENLNINAVNERRQEIIDCCSVLEYSRSNETSHAAASVKRMLNDSEFLFWLEFFSNVMPHVEILLSQFHLTDFDATKARASVDEFHSAIQNIKKEYTELNSVVSRNASQSQISQLHQVSHALNIIHKHCVERVRFTNHLEASKLLDKNNFPCYRVNFPKCELKRTVKAYPMLDKLKLEAELSVIYNRNDFCEIKNITDLMNVIIDNHLESLFSETVNLIKILITTPIPSDEMERYFSTTKRVKTFLRNTLTNEKLTALAIISIENEMIPQIDNFKEKVINHFATSNNPKMDFVFK